MLAKIIASINAEKNRVAHDATKIRPGEGKDISFEYGHRQGVYAGLDQAIQLIERIYRDVENDQRDL
jgi:hypothetical protein